MLVGVLLVVEAVLRTTISVHEDRAGPPPDELATPTVVQQSSISVQQSSTPTVSGHTSSPTPLPSVPRVPPSSALPSRQELVPKDSVGKENCKWPGNTGNHWRSEAALLRGDVYSNAMVCNLIKEGQSGWVDFLRPDWAEVLEISAGVTDDSPIDVHEARVRIEDSVTNEILYEGYASLGNPLQDDISVADRLRIRVRVTVVSEGSSSPQSGRFGFAGEWLR